MKALKNKTYESEVTNNLCAYAMAGAIILFDHMDTMSVFAKRSPINIKACINILKKDFASEVTISLLSNRSVFVSVEEALSLLHTTFRWPY